MPRPTPMLDTTHPARPPRRSPRHVAARTTYCERSVAHPRRLIYRCDDLFSEGVAPHVAASSRPDNPAGRAAACSERPIDVKHFARVEVRAAVAFRFGEAEDSCGVETFDRLLRDATLLFCCRLLSA